MKPKFLVRDPKSTTSVWTPPSPPSPPKEFPEGTIVVERLIDGFDRYVVEILRTCLIAGKVAEPGDRFEMYENDAGLCCGGSLAFYQEEGAPPTYLGAGPAGKIIEIIPATEAARIRKIEGPAQPEKGPFIAKLPR